MDFSIREQLNRVTLVLIVALACMLSQPVDAAAQRTQQEQHYPPHLQTKIQQMKNTKLGNQQTQSADSRLAPVQSGIDYGSLNGKYTIFTQDQVWNRNPNPNPSQNYALYDQGTPAGNINGDSLDVDSDGQKDNPIDDYIVTSRARNEQTSALEDQTWKTAVYFGGNTSGEPDQEFARKLVPIGDINGDGYADAVAVPTQSSLEYPTFTNQQPDIYKGTPSGYQIITDVDLDAAGVSGGINVGFNDYNYDGFDDVLTYFPRSNDMYITWGRGFNDGTFFYQEYSDVFSFQPKSLAVTNADEDSLKEIAVLSGYSSDGQINVFQVDTMAQGMLPSDALTMQQSFAYSALEYDAEYSRIQFTDVNGDSLSDIYVTGNGYGDHYLLPYDSTNSQYQTTPIKLFNGQMAPAGDLNNDGNDDFIIADTTDNDKAHIAYGPDDLSRSPVLQLDVNLSTNSSSDWVWRMNFNQQVGFGDLNGDGANDALLRHSEPYGSDPQIGRRILTGIVEPAQSHSSSFHMYPYENFFSSVFETEELGDINNDGTEDFAISYYYQNKVEIYFGGASVPSTPDKVINLGFSPYTLTSGDFDGDNVDDMIVMGYTSDSAQMKVFLGGSQMDLTADNTISASDFQSYDNPDMFNVQNIGDVNNDGVTDLLVGSSQASNTVSDTAEYVNEAYLFYGGSSITTTTTPDVTLNIAPAGRDYIWAGESSAALGDINGDGMNDFAVSAAYIDNGSSLGEVYIYYGGSNPDFSSPNMTLQPSQYTMGFGWGLTAGDFNGDGDQDLAVSNVQTYGETSTPSLVQIYNGGSEFDNVVDRSLVVPNFKLKNDNTDAGPLMYNYGRIESISDFTLDGKDELLVATGFGTGSHAAVYTFNTESYLPEIAIKAPNIGSELGYGYNLAVGNFTSDGQTDLVLTQTNDDNDAYNSSRVYRYGLNAPLRITKVEDVPDDQGRRIRIHTGGYLMEAMNRDIYGMDNWSVWRMTEDSSWTNVKTVSPSNNGANFVDVTVNKTQPTNVDSVDYSYTFRLEAFNRGLGGVIARSDTASGMALDNISPPQVQGVGISDQNGDQLVSWESSEANDVDKYLVYNTESSILSDSPVGASSSTNFTLPNSFSGVQNFAVKARDVNNNTGSASKLATAIFPKNVQYDMKSGWNLIGLPVNASADSIQKALGSASYIYEYSGGYSQVDQLKAGVGYWAKFTQDELRELQGNPVTELTLDLDEGWNLISGVGGELPLTLVQDPDGIIVQNSLYNFKQAYNESDTLRPSNGYWVQTSASGTVTFTHPKLVSGQQQSSGKAIPLAKRSDDITKNFSTVTVSDGEHSRELYFGASLPKQVDKRQFNLPPLAPGGLFDARFTTDSKLIEKAEGKIQLSRIEGTDLTVEVNPQNMAEQSRFLIRELTDGKELAAYKVDAGKKVTIKHSETNAIFVSAVGNSPLSQNNVPDEFKLKQNYPNPFNPTTQIEYSVTEASNVTLEVFNILGKRVATLINKEQQPGNYEVTFDGSNLASGVYLYRLQAGSNVSTKKLILAK